MGKTLLMTQEIFDLNVEKNPLFKKELFTIGKETPITKCKRAKNDPNELLRGETNCCVKSCGVAPQGYSFVCSLCNCVLVGNP